MIETIRKKICIDKSRSHTTGIMPFIPYGSDDARVNYVTTGDRSGNWGGFPLDLAIAKTTVKTGAADLQFREFRYATEDGGCKWSDDTNRLKHAEIMRRYNTIQKILDNSVYGKAVLRYKNEEGKVICEQQPMDDCSYEISEPDKIPEVVLSPKFGEVSDKKENLLGQGDNLPDRYAFIPMSMEGFKMDTTGSYENEDADLVEGRYYVLMPDYETYRKYEDMWRSWWNFQTVDYRRFFDVPEGEFLFCRTVEKYIIGKEFVPETITGVRVPQYVYYTEVERYKHWFEKNNLTTEDEIYGRDGDLLRRFEERGGLAFYRFLCEVGNRRLWIRNLPEEKDYYSMNFVVPYISVPISLEDHHEYGGIYESYLYSYSEKDNEFVDAYEEFTNHDGGTISRWIEPEDLYTDSMLTSVMDAGATELGGMTGIWTEWDDNETKSNIFRCEYHEGTSSVIGELRRDEYGNVETVTEERAPLVNGADRVILVFKRRQRQSSVYDDSVVTEYVKYKYGWWECTRVSTEEAKTITLGEGEEIPSGTRKYRSITVLDVIRSVEPTPNNGDVFYFLARKDNGEHNGQAGRPVGEPTEEISLFRLPFTPNSFHNMRESDVENIFVGDYIIDIEENEDFWTIRYVIGGDAESDDGGETFTPVPQTGVHYEETYAFRKNEKMITFVDGNEDVNIYYDWIDTESSKQTIYNEELGLYRKVNRAKIIGMEVGSDFIDGNAIDAMVFTKESSEYLPSGTKDIVDVVLDRGNAAAFERHFKLSECNTFEDLKNYGNNFYNL